MTPSILLALTLLPNPSSDLRPALPGTVEPATGAWAVVHAGQLWVCWSEHPDCWRRVEFEEPPHVRDDIELAYEDPVDPLGLDAGFVEDELVPELEFGPERWRLGFDASANLWIELEDQRWRVDFGQPRARLVGDATSVRLGRPRNLECGPSGRRPALVAGQLAWQPAPRCAPPPAMATCIDTSIRPRPRKPSPVRLRAGIEVTVPHGWTSSDLDVASPTVARLRPSAALEVMFVVELGFDPTRALDTRARAVLLARSRLRTFPMPPPGPLAEAERQAMLVAACGGDR